MSRTILSLLFAAGALAAAPQARADDDYVRLSLVSPAPSPYRMIRYEITRRAPATTAVHRRLLPGHGESLHTLGLMTREEADAAFAVVHSVDAMQLGDAQLPATRAAPGALTWRVELLVDGTAHRFDVTAPEQQPDPRYQILVDEVRRRVRAVAGELPFRNVFFAAKQRGWLNVVSVPSGRVTVDGFDTQLDTPLYHYELSAGRHEVTITSADPPLTRTYQVTVEPQGTTTVRVDLR